MMLLLWQSAALLGGSSVGALGVYLVGLRMPFLGIGLAHAAMAGAVFAHLAGLPAAPAALAAALAAGWGLAWLATTPLRVDLGAATSILLSLTMGLAFLGMGLNRGEMTPLLSLMWGSMLFVGGADVALMAALLAAQLAFLGLFGRPLDALLFSRPAARASGLHERRLLTLFLGLAALIITLNLQIVGGLMMYSLLTNPAAAAYELGRGMRQVRWLAAAFGMASTCGGFWLSWCWDLPTGACIVLVSTLLYAVAALATRRAKAA